ncbi:hypothetical protein [Asticcacaulis sp. AC402]|uniref:hypothetical protein n=1 Tax=Asticcacaulis sp. AC402 TaxID=1282361 RepID=UPI0003C3E5DF|nr:hypothetical protein [Asticcacaulis sp. AC402]ESQ74797.1 hypothetical protein ABAC402_12895 [Asticcacaulis sp. AC402]
MADRGPDLWLAAGRTLVVAGIDITLEALCAETGKTRGSFYHHFTSVQHYRDKLLENWRRKATLDIITAVEQHGRHRAEALNRMATREDHRFERALRGLAIRHADVATIVEDVDSRREDYIARLAREDLQLEPAAAEAVARLGIALFIAGQLRAPDNLQAFNAGAEAWLMAAVTSVPD